MLWLPGRKPLPLRASESSYIKSDLKTAYIIIVAVIPVTITLFDAMLRLLFMQRFQVDVRSRVIAVIIVVEIHQLLAL
jgi:hypothetical protein